MTQTPKKIYMEGTKFELKHFDNPDHMHRSMLYLSVALSWNATGDPINDPDNYVESFDLVDNHDASNNRTGMTRAETDQLCWDIYCDEIYK